MKKSVMTKVLIGVLGAVLLLGAVAAVAYVVTMRVLNPPEAEEEAQPTFQVELGEFTTNLADLDGRRFIKVKIEAEVSGSGVIQELREKSSLIRDQILGILRSKTYAEVNGEEGMRELGEEIVTRLNSLLERGIILRLYFLEFVVH